MTDSCPKCGFAREPQRLDCPVCGIVFARYRARPETATALPQEGYLPPGFPPPGFPPPGFPPPEGPAGEEGGAASSDTFYEGPAVNPYAAPRASVLLRRPADEPALAGRGSRLAARFVDGLVLVGALLPALLVGVAAESNEPTAANVALAVMGLGLLALGIVNLYFLARDGQTLGKKALKVRIVMLDGEKARLGRILVMRILAPGLLGAVPIVGPIFAIVNILFIFGAEQRCLHDHFAGTKVVVA